MAKTTDEASKDTVQDTPPKAKQKQQISSTTRNILLGAGILAVVLVAFGAGIQARDYHRRSVETIGFGGTFTKDMRGFRGRYGGPPQTENGIVLSGKVTAVNGNDFTVDQNGSSKAVKTDGNTVFRGVGISGLKSGDQVVVSGTTNSDGSIQAMSVVVGAATAAGASSSVAPSAGTSTQSF